MNYLKKLNKLLMNNGLAINAEKIVNLINKFNESYIIEDSLQKQLKEIHNEAFDYVLLKYTEPEQYKNIIEIGYKLWFLFTDRKVIVCTSYKYGDVFSRMIYLKYLVLKNRFQNWYFYEDNILNCVDSRCTIVRGAFAASEVLGITFTELLDNIENAVEVKEQRKLILGE